MIQEIELRVLPKDIQNETHILNSAAKTCNVSPKDIQEIKALKRSIDARKHPVVYRLRLQVFIKETPQAEPAFLANFNILDKAPEVIVVGAGPAGYFAALELIEAGLKPILFDRGKDVQTRRRDLRAIQQFGEVDPDSNYCFGEGGAGTYSDGKLYTRSLKRGSVYKALKLLVEHGATSDILVDAHPHIGSNKLPKIVANIRETILHYGGEIHFNAKVVDFLCSKGKMQGIRLENGNEYQAPALILATGHSARDIYRLLHEKNINLEQKSFALGVRIEHPQALIDKIQYHRPERSEHLPAASYRLACQVKGSGVFSFCMCPGGLVVPAATAPGEIVVNGMSLSRRDSPFANSGTVTEVDPSKLQKFQKYGVFAGLEFQKSVEQAVFKAGDGSQKAPAQRLTDFTKKKISASLPNSSYIPGLYPAALHEILPPWIYQKLQAGVQQFGKKMRGYYTEEANVIATESRTSSPLKIPRNKETFMHEEMEGLFPCGEGAGYAGGIISAAMDGQNVARAVARFLKPDFD